MKKFTRTAATLSLFAAICAIAIVTGMRPTAVATAPRQQKDDKREKLQRLKIQTFRGEAAALRADRIKLENVRRGQFEGLSAEVLKDESKRPDLGGPSLHPTAGAVIVGARKVLIAYNINLRSTDLDLAKSIANRIRASSGGFPSVKALGLPLDRPAAADRLRSHSSK